MTLDDLHLDAAALARLCQRHGVERLDVFGSFARGDARAGSDLDLLISLRPGAAPGMEFLQLAIDLEALAGRRIDLLERHLVEGDDQRPIFRREVLRHAKRLYGPAAA